MSKTKLPHFPLFFGDLLAATPRPKWKGPHRSLYVLLLAHQWFYGPIPTTPAEIADMCDWPLDDFERLWKVVGTKFIPCEGGLFNPRCEEHREKAAKISKKRSTAGKKGGETTRSKIKQTGQQNGQQTGEQTGQQKGVANAAPFAAPFAGPSIPSHPIPSDPTPTQGARFARDLSRASAPEEDQQGGSEIQRREGWQRSMSRYPTYNGRKNWIIAENAAHRLVETGRATWEQIEERTQRYADFCRLTKRQVMRPENFFTTADDPPCLQSWDIPDDAGDSSSTRGDDVINEWLREQQAKEG